MSEKTTGKDVIYIDVDEEITAIIEKVHASTQRIVALVLPKRASAFQSVVNMKLLKRTADRSNKHIVLITGDSSLLPLAGDVGLHVAKSLQSKPEIPAAPPATGEARTGAMAIGSKIEQAEEVETESAVPIDRSKTLAELSDDEETIELDDEEDPPKPDNTKSVQPKSGKSKKFSIPNFNKFRLWILIGGATVVALLIFGFLALVVLPKAKVVVSTDSTAIAISQDLNLKTGANVTLDVAQAVVPATKQEIKKTLSQEVPATGQQNNGTAASGSVDMTAKNCSTFNPPPPVAAGTGLTANGRTYITQEKSNFSNPTFDGSCLVFKSRNVKIIAQGGGAASNVDSATFVVVGRTDVTATGSASGGTDNIIKIVSQADIDSAKQKIGTQDAEAIKLELKQALQTAGLIAVESTFTTATPKTTQSAEVGAQADTVSVTQEVVYSMLGVKKDDLQQLVSEKLKTEIDPTKQSILDYGLDEAVFTQLRALPDGAAIGFQTTAIAGSDLKEDEIKQQIAGKKASEAKEIIQQNPGVTDVEVTYSPFWVSSIPKKASKITLVIEEPQVAEDASPNTNQ